ncbi:hypothetical protein ABZW47_31055 [Streptomyces sp. NPDC004549]|uniref:hypothetical protein n=1 Tax=Streptomyces sp. NPDC004549 TaxID=3154283 RepID=UPI0033AFBD7A
MGRNKPGKPRRPRMPRQFRLRELQPPGQGYEEWITIPSATQPLGSAPGLSAGAVQLMERMAVLGPLYDGQLPTAALYLDELIDSGSLPMIRDGAGVLVPIAEMAEMMSGRSGGDVRESLHGLHAAGVILMADGADGNMAGVRMVAQRPKEPGQPWRFMDEDVAVATTCIPTHIWEELPPEVASAVAFLRTCRSRLEEPDPEVYGRHQGVNGSEHAKELFAAALASGFVDEKGCEACPTGHLCTRSGD